MASKRIILISGGNAGYGLEIVKCLYSSQQAYEIILGSRSVAKGQEAADAIRAAIPQSASSISVVAVDVESDESIDKAFEEVSSKHDHIDCLINNAGAAFDLECKKGKMTMRESFSKAWDVNVTGAHLLSWKFAPLLIKSSNPYLLFVGSGVSSLKLTENKSLGLNKSPAKGWPKNEVLPNYSYRSTKTGLSMIMREWNRLLAEDGVKVFGISPPLMSTNLTFDPDLLKSFGNAESPAEQAQYARKVIEGERDADAGLLIRMDSVQEW